MRTSTRLAILVVLAAACDGTNTGTAQRVEPDVMPPPAVETPAAEPEPPAEAIEEPPVADEPPVQELPVEPTPVEPEPAPAPEVGMTDPISEMDEPRGNAISEFPGQDNRISEMDDDERPDRISDMSESKK